MYPLKAGEKRYIPTLRNETPNYKPEMKELTHDVDKVEAIHNVI